MYAYKILNVKKLFILSTIKIFEIPIFSIKYLVNLYELFLLLYYIYFKYYILS